MHPIYQWIEDRTESIISYPTHARGVAKAAALELLIIWFCDRLRRLIHNANLVGFRVRRAKELHWNIIASRMSEGEWMWGKDVDLLFGNVSSSFPIYDRPS